MQVSSRATGKRLSYKHAGSQFQGMCGVMTMVLWLAAVPPTAPVVCWPEESQRILFTSVTLHASLIC
eukprot:1096815-Amphidinium_carterae.1